MKITKNQLRQIIKEELEALGDQPVEPSDEESAEYIPTHGEQEALSRNPVEKALQQMVPSLLNGALSLGEFLNKVLPNLAPGGGGASFVAKNEQKIPEK
jgi:uncharacterized membrane protein YheB (UPF0754 family)